MSAEANTQARKDIPLISGLGRWVIAELSALRTAWRLWQGVCRSWRTVEWHAAIQQTHEVTNRSALLVFVVMAFTGAILIVQGGTQAQRIVGDLSPIGPAFLQLLIREFGPVITAFMIAARYGAGIAAELGSMKVTEQVDALRLAGAPPMSYLVLPRIYGGLLGMLPIIVFGSVVAYYAGAVTAFYGFGVGWDTYFSTSFVKLADVSVGVAKSLAFGIAVPLMSCDAGLNARGGAAGVGQATTRAVISSSVLVLFLDLVVGTLGYVLLG
ncbi:MAG: ABC transporter permease [Myxococcota bacterium]|jgi:phospholipid/cholesterol/gamma-HCH transport system permease protein|nr:ABC transporter permease [Myxococcota bacterium]